MLHKDQSWGVRSGCQLLVGCDCVVTVNEEMSWPWIGRLSLCLAGTRVLLTACLLSCECSQTVVAHTLESP